MWSYSGNPEASRLDAVRFTIGDTEESFSFITDEEINYCLTQSNNNVELASIRCLERIVAKLAKTVDYKIGPESVSASDRFKHYKEVLAELKADRRNKFAVPDIGRPLPHEPAFDVGMHDNC